MRQKEVDDVLGGDGAWDNVDQTAAQCPNKDCDNGTRAYFFQLQIRSADEPVSDQPQIAFRRRADQCLDDNLL